MTKYAESYLHKYAKVVLSAWLRKKIRIGSNFKGLNNIDLSALSPKSYPMFGVYTEYPVCSDKSDKIVGLHVSWPDWLKSNNVSIKNKTNVPTVYDIKDIKKLKLLYVFDAVILDKDTITHVFEIEHKNPSSPEKVQFILDHKIIGYELSAQKIMEQVKLPFSLEFTRYWGPPITKSIESPPQDGEENVESSTE